VAREPDQSLNPDAPQSVPGADELCIVDTAADDRFRTLARAMSLDVEDRWLGGYAHYVWARARGVFETLPEPIAGARVLEFGCNFGATSITLAKLGAHVVAVDVSSRYIELASANAARYGIGSAVDFLHVPDTRRLPFPDGHFDLITCCSVLEYVPPPMLGDVQRELDRVLRPGGLIIITGTSNRLWPREVHSRKWLVNYVPRGADRWLPQAWRERGASPWRIRRGFGTHYENLDRVDRGRTYREVKRRMGAGGAKRALLAMANAVSQSVGLSVGLVTPSVWLRLRKQGIDRNRAASV
jgi:2-polyprenyl-3-methyl-5-hydroxy-6-metoxy-1,4-benzoquinol methylase